MESILSLIVLIGLFQLGKAKVEQQAREREQRLAALEKALANPSIDRATLQQLAQQLTGAKAPKASSSTGLAWLLAIGWITLFTGAGVWSIGYMLGEDDALAGGVVVMLIGFGLVTYPFALRDMESRRSQS